MKKLFLLLILAGVVGCTTMGSAYSPAPAPTDGKALIYFMRASVAYGNFWPTTFSVNDTVVVSLYDKGYSWMYLDPGVYKITGGTHLNNDYLKFVMPVSPGAEYYVEFTQESIGSRTYRNQIHALKPEEAKARIAAFTYKAADTVVVQKWSPTSAPRARLSEADELEYVKKIAKQNKCAISGEPNKTAKPESKSRMYDVPCESRIMKFECGAIKEGSSDETCWLL